MSIKERILKRLLAGTKQVEARRIIKETLPEMHLSYDPHKAPPKPEKKKRASGVIGTSGIFIA